MSKKLTIIIPCYNSALTIEETLQSVENACYDFKDYEIVLVNDGSVDCTQSILEAYQTKNNANITIINKNNGGVSEARNCAIDVAKGEYILFLDSDDLLAKSTVSLLFQEFKGEDTVSFFRTSSYKAFAEKNNRNDKAYNISPIELLKELTYSKKKLGFCCFLYKKSILNSFQIRFNTGIKYGEDWEFATKFLARCKTATRINRNLYFYRKRLDSATHTITYFQTDAVQAARNTSEYLNAMQHEFSLDYSKYMEARAVFSVAHRFASGKSWDCYERLHRDYDVRTAMKALLKNNQTDWKSRLMAIAYLIHRNLFYILAQIFG